MIKKMIARLLNKEIPPLLTLFPKLNLAGFGKEVGLSSQIPVQIQHFTFLVVETNLFVD
jgi:hypothetical protein